MRKSFYLWYIEQYLVEKHFIVKLDLEKSYMALQQRNSTPFQQFWLFKLVVFDYEIQYRSGNDNVLFDALS